MLFQSFNSFFPSVCLPPRQQAERRPQTRADSESYEKARDYFSEGKTNKQTRERTMLHRPNLVIMSCMRHHKSWLVFIPAALRRQQDGGFFKSPHYPGYPFLMIPDLTNPYLSNGSLSPSARTVSVPVCSWLSFPHFCRTLKKKTTTWAVRKSFLYTTRPPYSLRVASQGVVTTSLFFLGGIYTSPRHPTTTSHSAQSLDY